MGRDILDVILDIKDNVKKLNGLRAPWNPEHSLTSDMIIIMNKINELQVKDMINTSLMAIHNN